MLETVGLLKIAISLYDDKCSGTFARDMEVELRLFLAEQNLNTYTTTQLF